MSVDVNWGNHRQIAMARIEADVDRCGKCNKFMCSFLCPREKGFEKSKFNPTAASFICSDYDPKESP